MLKKNYFTQRTSKGPIKTDETQHLYILCFHKENSLSYHDQLAEPSSNLTANSLSFNRPTMRSTVHIIKIGVTHSFESLISNSIPYTNPCDRNFHALSLLPSTKEDVI